MGKTNLEMLLWGMEHIAKNHGFECDLDYEENGNVCIVGGCNVPTLADVKMLCEDVGIEPEYIDACDCGIDVWLPLLWWNGKANEPYVKGMEMWRRKMTP